MDYLNKLWSKHMPEQSPKVAVDGHPRLSGIMDTINATDAHGPATKLPSEFYDKKGRSFIDQIAVEEWFAGYGESNEYRKLGIGALLADVVDRMVSTAVEGGWRSETNSSDLNPKDNGKAIKFAMSGCHDTTLAAILSSLGGFQNGHWPPFTSSVVIELFSQAPNEIANAGSGHSTPDVASKKPGVFSSLFGGKKSSMQSPTSETARTQISDLPEKSREALSKHYVRIRFNDVPVLIPGCAVKPENHLPGDETFCTLDAFKTIVDKFTPKDWTSECMDNLNEGLFGPGDKERINAGF